MSGILLDTHALYWAAIEPQRLVPRALVAIGVAQREAGLFVSAISAWETALATQKPIQRGRLETGGLSAAEWFREAVSRIGAEVVSIDEQIAHEAALVVVDSSHKDPGDCHLIATARVRRLTLVTRDAAIHRIARDGYLKTITC